MKLDHLLFSPRVRGNVVAFPADTQRLDVAHPPLRAHWTLDPRTRLPACHWHALVDACANSRTSAPAR